MIRTLALVSLAAAMWADTGSTGALLKGVEQRYNRAKTLKVLFTETYSVQQRVRKPESGTLYLRKPGRMRWDYQSPAGKLFLSDGKHAYLYTPASGRVEKMKLKESEDMRAPLAFLLGKLDFSKDFKDFQKRMEGEDAVLTAVPKSGKLPYSSVEFSVTPDHCIRRLVVRGQDQSVLSFTFEQEQINPALKDSLFHFDMPAGAAFADLSEGDSR
ncbi:MAG: outer membrane lipoprotein carrier protein LolA [Bryobacterales bacterium]|nr:outer membrane lipoprotein carrier protein LolA [Bryobacterales bacterium]